jgi:hypothetical protein
MSFMDDRQAYRKTAREQGTPDHVIEWMLQLARPRVVFRRSDWGGADRLASAAPVAGYFGGNPWLPDDVEWAGTPHFLASIDCAALRTGALDFPFPEDGHLLFFADMNEPDFDPAEEDGYARVVYVPAGTATAERVPPGNESAFVPERFPLRHELHWTMPADYSYEYLLLSDDSRILFDKYNGSELGNESWPYDGQIALGGHPVQIQDSPLLRFLPDDFSFPVVAVDPRTKASDAAARIRDDLPLPSLSGGPHLDAGGWLLLAEMRADLIWDSTPAVTYWMIRRDDLAERRFDRVKYDVQILE